MFQLPVELTYPRLGRWREIGLAIGMLDIEPESSLDKVNPNAPITYSLPIVSIVVPFFGLTGDLDIGDLDLYRFWRQLSQNLTNLDKIKTNKDK